MSLTFLLTSEHSILLGLVVDASTPLVSAPPFSRVTGAATGGGVRRSAAGALTAVNKDIVVSVSED